MISGCFSLTFIAYTDSLSAPRPAKNASLASALRMPHKAHFLKAN